MDLRLTALYQEPEPGANTSSKIDGVLMDKSIPTKFCVETLAAGIAEGCTPGAIKYYLQRYPKLQVEVNIKGLVAGCNPILFYSLERNCLDCLELLF